MKKYTLISSILIMGFSLVQAQAPAAAATKPEFFSDLFVQIILIAAAIVLLVAVLVLYRLLMAVIKVEQIKIYREHGLEAYLEAEKKPTESWLSRVYKSWTAAVPVEQEADVMLHHDFDGIRELDNKLPPWWVGLFYITIIWAGVYLFYYHFSDMGPSSHEEYLAEVQAGEEQAEAYLAKQANAIDENSVTLLEDEASLAKGKAIFMSTCSACHGQQGEGGVGPNMTDNYFIHGNRIQDYFKVIKYGVPEKGMISWQSQIRPLEMQQVASYMLSLVGTTPPNPKEPQGTMMDASTPGTAGEAAAPDSTNTTPAIDSTKGSSL